LLLLADGHSADDIAAIIYGDIEEAEQTLL
jgi:hypothetical protein